MVEPFVLMTVDQFVTAAELAFVSVTETQYPAPQSEVTARVSVTPFWVIAAPSEFTASVLSGVLEAHAPARAAQAMAATMAERNCLMIGSPSEGWLHHVDPNPNYAARRGPQQYSRPNSPSRRLCATIHHDRLKGPRESNTNGNSHVRPDCRGKREEQPLVYTRLDFATNAPMEAG